MKRIFLVCIISCFMAEFVQGAAASPTAKALSEEHWYENPALIKEFAELWIYREWLDQGGPESRLRLNVELETVLPIYERRVAEYLPHEDWNEMLQLPLESQEWFDTAKKAIATAKRLSKLTSVWKPDQAQAKALRLTADEKINEDFLRKYPAMSRNVQKVSGLRSDEETNEAFFRKYPATSRRVQSEAEKLEDDAKLFASPKVQTPEEAAEIANINKLGTYYSQIIGAMKELRTAQKGLLNQQLTPELNKTMEKLKNAKKEEEDEALERARLLKSSKTAAEAPKKSFMQGSLERVNF